MLGLIRDKNVLVLFACLGLHLQLLFHRRRRGRAFDLALVGVFLVAVLLDALVLNSGFVQERQPVQEGV